MGFAQYHKPSGELLEQIRTLACMMLSLIEEAEAIDWYEQRLAVEKDRKAMAIMQGTQREKAKHLGIGLEFQLRKAPV
jgi:hypothetical protein